MKPENGAEKIYMVCGVNCIAISDWNEHYIKENNVEDIIIFDVTAQVYLSWQEYKEFSDFNQDNEFNEGKARVYLKRLRYKVWKPISSISKKMSLKTKKKIQNGWAFCQTKKKGEA
jgi:hypothetical protein